MPSPFPGMDPYLESPAIWPDFHQTFVVNLKAALQPTLPEPYFARTEERIWIERPERSALPDVSVLRPGRPDVAPRDGAIAVLEEAAVDTEPVEIVPGYEEREIFLQVFTGGPGQPRQLVTAIELLSPSNKAAGSAGRTAYRAKQSEFLARGVHLIEIDVLRGGRHTTAIPRDKLKRPFDYHISVRDRNKPPTEMYSYPILLEQSLPRLAVPLLPGEGYVTVELQQVFDRCYDTSSYGREIDYRRAQLEPPLDEARRAWARERIDRWLSTASP
jgi:hypothetical protein